MGKLITFGIYGLGLWVSYSIGKRGIGRTIVAIEDTIDNIRKWGRDKLDDVNEDRQKAQEERSKE